MPWAPMTWGLLTVFGFCCGVWLAQHGYAQPAVSLCFLTGGFVQLSEICRQAFVQDFNDALTDTHLHQRDAAHWMKLDPSDLGKMLRGDQRFDVWRIEMLPEETRRCFYFRRTKRLGLPEFIRTAVKMVPAFDVERSA